MLSFIQSQRVELPGFFLFALFLTAYDEPFHVLAKHVIRVFCETMPNKCMRG